MGKTLGWTPIKVLLDLKVQLHLLLIIQPFTVNQRSLNLDPTLSPW